MFINKLKEWTYLWTPSAWNMFGVVMEEKKMGKYRHRTFDDFLNPTPWKAGQHPIAQKLRESGKAETQGFRKKY